MIFSLFPEQTVDGAGTASDDLALKREEEKMKKDEDKKFDNLPGDGGEKILDVYSQQFHLHLNENTLIYERRKQNEPYNKRLYKSRS